MFTLRAGGKWACSMAEEDIGGQNVGHEARHRRTGGV